MLSTGEQPMTCARTVDGGVLHFPPSYATDTAGVIMPPPERQLVGMIDRIAPDDLLTFIRGLKKARKRRRWQPRWAAVNNARLALMHMAADRAATEDLPGNIDFALGEFRWGR
jgi:hypothetical protein